MNLVGCPNNFGTVHAHSLGHEVVDRKADHLKFVCVCRVPQEPGLSSELSPPFGGDECRDARGRAKHGTFAEGGVRGGRCSCSSGTCPRICGLNSLALTRAVQSPAGQRNVPNLPVFRTYGSVLPLSAKQFSLLPVRHSSAIRFVTDKT